MNKRFGIILGVLVVGAIAFFALRPQHTSETETPVAETSQADLAAPVTQATPSVAEVNAPPVPDGVNAADDAANTKARQEKFVDAIKGINTCLQLVVDPGEPQDPSFENFSGAIMGATGEPVIRNDDWSKTLLQLPNGEKRSIRVEMDYTTGEFVRKLKYEILHDDGTEPEPIPLSTEQSDDPNETFMASLESDGKVVSKERKARLYYANGAEVMYTEKNGLMTSLEMSMVEGKKYKCTQLDTGASSCSCQ